jgi:hypothetical protein
VEDDPSSEPVDLIKKYVLVMRDPRDTVVSLMHYNTKYSADDPAQLSANVREYFPHYVAWQVRRAIPPLHSVTRGDRARRGARCSYGSAEGFVCWILLVGFLVLLSNLARLEALAYHVVTLPGHAEESRARV